MGFSSDPALTSNQLPVSLYLPNLDALDYNQILELYLKRIIAVVNTKEGATYSLTENANFCQFFTSGVNYVFRNGYRKTFELPATAAGATTTIAHGITNVTEFTRIEGTCITDVVDYRPIPYASATTVNTQIEINIDATNINVINGTAAPNITSGIIILEYLKT